MKLASSDDVQTSVQLSCCAASCWRLTVLADRFGGHGLPV